MLRHRADIKTVSFMAMITGLLFIQWNLGEVHPLLVITAIIMSVPVAVIAHNHNHLPMWNSKALNAFTDYWLTLFYGFPPFAWIPTHNTNHHLHNNKVPDYTITYRISEANNLFTLLTYPSISGGIQQKAVVQFVKDTWKKDRPQAIYYLSQVAILITYLTISLTLDWKKALLFIVIPQQFSLFSVLIFNYIQHVHADEDSKWNHSRNFIGGFMNAFLFNNGFHTIHHMHPRKHWSENNAGHQTIAGRIDPALTETNWGWYMFRVYILGLFFPSFRTTSMRLKRMNINPGSTPKEVISGMQTV